MVVLGVLFEIGATMVGTAGKQLVSYSSGAESKAQANMFKILGLLLTTLIGPILDMAAYALAPQIIIAPLNGLDIVWNTLFAPFTLGERVTRRHAIGSALVFGGAALTSLFGPQHVTRESPEWLQDVFLSFRFLAYVLVFSAGLALSFVTLSNHPKGSGDKARGVALGLTAGGIAGNMFFISAGLGLLRSSATTGNWSYWTHWLPYPVLLCGILVAVSNIPFMTKGLDEYEALFMVTLFEGCHITVACISGAWVLKEMDHEAPERTVMYWACVLLIVAGLLVIQTAASSKSAKDRPLSHKSQSSMNCDNVEAPEVVAPDPSPELPSPSMAAGARLGPPMTGQPTMSRQGSRNSTAEGIGAGRPGPINSGVVVWAGSFSGIGTADFDSDDDAEGSSEDDDDTSSAVAEEDGQDMAVE